MAITVTPMRLTNSNTGYAPMAATGTSAVAGTAETFEFAFPAKDETIHIIITNGSVGPVSAKLVANPGKGFNPPTLNLAIGKMGVFRIESGYVKDSNGKISLVVTPAEQNTVSGSGVKVYGVYSGVVTR
ncbi:MAG: hypothetical protein ACOX3X_09825 [Eubacteriales bacterium]|jgi:hypothetical protein